MRLRTRLLFLLVVPSTLLVSLVRCTGDDPKITPECSRDDQCGVNGKCDLAAGKCIIGGLGDGSVGDGDPNQPPGSKVIVLGQPDEFSNIELELGMGQPIGVALSGGKVVVGEYNTNRILIYNQIPTTNLKRPDVVVGRADLKDTSQTAVTRQSINPGYFCDCVTTDANRLLLGDSNRNRGLLWNAIPTANHTGADNVLGASDFTSILQQTLPDASFPSPLPPTPATLATPCGMTIAGTHLFIADQNNHRVLGWNQIPTTNGRPADFVLGQASLTANGTTCIPGNEKACIVRPTSVFSDGTRLWVTDAGHNRVLQWNSIPTTNNVAADYVIGQPNATTFGPNGGGNDATKPTDSTLFDPARVFSDGTRLFVADQKNNRVLMWNQIPTGDGAKANIVIGQPTPVVNDPMHGIGVPDSQSLVRPIGVVSDGTHVLISDTGTNRVLIYNQIPTATNPAADLVIGRPSLTAKRIREPDAKTFGAGGSTFTDGKRFYLGETSRVLVWDHIPTGPQDGATFVLGQETLTDFEEAFPTSVSAGRFHIPLGMWADDTRLVVSDLFRFRVLIWQKPITANHQLPDIVLGQASFDAASDNEDPRLPPTSTPPWPPTAASVSRPGAVFSDGTHLVLSDTTNSRVLIWDTFPTQTHQAANHVLGQPNMTSRATPDTPTASTLRRPGGIAYDAATQMLFITDVEHHRVLGWKGFPTTDNAPATVVIGQNDFTSAQPNAGLGSRSAKGLNLPQGVVIKNGRLYVADKANNRILVWNQIPTSENGRPADAVLGQPNMEAGDANFGGLGPGTLAAPKIYAASDGRLWVNDEANSRILGLPIP